MPCHGCNSSLTTTCCLYTHLSYPHTPPTIPVSNILPHCLQQAVHIPTYPIHIHHQQPLSQLSFLTVYKMLFIYPPILSTYTINNPCLKYPKHLPYSWYHLSYSISSTLCTSHCNSSITTPTNLRLS